MGRVIRFILGPILILGGLWFIAMPFAFATMRFGDPARPPTWGEYLGEVFRGSVLAIVIGLILVIGGGYLAIARDLFPERGKETMFLAGRVLIAIMAGVSALVIWLLFVRAG